MSTTIIMNKALLRALCALVSTDETRIILNGLYFESIGKRLVCVATNGRMMAVVDVTHSYNILPPEGLSVIVPKPRLLPEVLTAEESEDGVDFVAGEESKLYMPCEIREGRAFWKDHDGLEITAPLIEGKFPDWRKVLEQNRDAVGDTIIPASLNPQYLAHAMAVISAWLAACECRDGVSFFPARGTEGHASAGCAHIIRPKNERIKDGAVVLLMPMRAKEGPETQFESLIPAWMFEKGGQP